MSLNHLHHQRLLPLICLVIYCLFGDPDGTFDARLNKYGDTGQIWHETIVDENHCIRHPLIKRGPEHSTSPRIFLTLAQQSSSSCNYKPSPYLLSNPLRIECKISCTNKILSEIDLLERNVPGPSSSKINLGKNFFKRVIRILAMNL